MRLHDPARPRHFHHPQYVRPDGSPIETMPHPRVILEQDGTVTIDVFLLSPALKIASRHTLNVWRGHLPDFVDRWEEDPEKVMVEEFGYTMPSSTGKDAGRVITLDDFGLG